VPKMKFDGWREGREEKGKPREPQAKKEIT
jgi:hypothetical protein